MSHEMAYDVWPLPPIDACPPDDTEESVVGTDLHQTTIINLRLGINEVAHLQRRPDGALPWQALSQTLLLGCRRRDDTAYRTLPDVFVYRRPIAPTRASVSIGVDGPPLLIVEVLSDSTFDNDLDLEVGKGYSYARAGVREYMTLDPTGSYLPHGIQAWRLVDGVYRTWQPDADGRWHSAEIGISIGIEGALAAVYSGDGQRQLREGEVATEIAELRRQLRALQGEE